MNDYMLPLIAYALGLPSAWAWAMLVYALNERKATQAAVWDGIVTGMGTLGALTLWSQSGDDWRVLVAWMLGNCTGTFINVYHKARSAGTKMRGTKDA